MKRKKDRPKYLWVHMTDEEIFAYSPVFYTNMKDALQALRKDIKDIAKNNGYRPGDVMLLSIHALVDDVKDMWEGWNDVEQETEI